MITLSELILRLLIGAGFGALIGIERERQSQPAGLRTHIILVTGATLASILSIEFAGLLPNQGDPGRLAAQVISGIGFLGAGAILRFGANIKGLTTAASLWTMAVVGLAVGAGFLLPALATTILLLLALTVVTFFERRVLGDTTLKVVTLTMEHKNGLPALVRRIFKQHGQHVEHIKIQRSMRSRRVRLEALIRTHEPDFSDELIEEISNIPGLRSYRIE